MDTLARSRRRLLHRKRRHRQRKRRLLLLRPKAKKAMESAGLNPEEKVELDKLKNDIIDMKKDLKDAGMTGGQINKDPNMVKMVTRLNELKEKESGPAPAKKK